MSQLVWGVGAIPMSCWTVQALNEPLSTQSCFDRFPKKQIFKVWGPLYKFRSQNRAYKSSVLRYLHPFLHKNYVLFLPILTRILNETKREQSLKQLSWFLWDQNSGVKIRTDCLFSFVFSVHKRTYVYPCM